MLVNFRLLMMAWHIDKYFIQIPLFSSTIEFFFGRNTRLQAKPPILLCFDQFSGRFGENCLAYNWINMVFLYGEAPYKWKSFCIPIVGILLLFSKRFTWTTLLNTRWLNHLVGLVQDILKGPCKYLNGSFPTLFYTPTHEIPTLLYSPSM